MGKEVWQGTSWGRVSECEHLSTARFVYSKCKQRGNDRGYISHFDTTEKILYEKFLLFLQWHKITGYSFLLMKLNDKSNKNKI